ncbi:hypothetical protein PIB30_037536 [Stylosanthes scabra]|uniref:Uncharacterized protein n=1 Tax=Stylosanthes scabra TaxID=79078 RepID=A0ABU6REB8_9FABA|nr:hypothetical protein [Stylosanthes scabra]
MGGRCSSPPLLKKTRERIETEAKATVAGVAIEPEGDLLPLISCCSSSTSASPVFCVFILQRSDMVEKSSLKG